MRLLHRHLSFLLTAACAASSNFAQAKVSELPGARDHRLISRFAGSVLENMSDECFASIRVPAGPGHGGGSLVAFDKVATVEGHVSAYFYVVPTERSALEVFRNYESALKGAGFTTLYTCELRAGWSESSDFIQYLVE